MSQQGTAQDRLRRRILIENPSRYLRFSHTTIAEPQFLAEVVRPIFAQYPAVKLRFYDAEAFSGRCTDMAVFETADIRAYTFLIDALRDTPFFGLPHFEVLEVIPAIENSYREYDAAMGVTS